MKRLLAGALLAVAAAAHAATETRSCDFTTAPDGGFTLACKAPAATPGPVTPIPPPAGPTTPPAPPAGPTPPPSSCPPNLNPFICALIGAGNTTSGPSGGPAGGGGFDRAAFDFRDGDSLRIAGGGTRSATATHDATVHFSVGDMVGNTSSARHVTVSVNGQVVDEASGVYVVTRQVPVRVGDMIALTVTGDGNVVANARLAVS